MAFKILFGKLPFLSEKQIRSYKYKSKLVQSPTLKALFAKVFTTPDKRISIEAFHQGISKAINETALTILHEDGLDPKQLNSDVVAPQN